MIAAAFDQDVSLAFMDDGVYQLKKGFNTKGIEVKNFQPTYRALDDYDINKLYVEKEALEARGLAASKRVDTESKAKLKANGMQVLEPSAQLKADMKKVGETMLTEWLEKSGADGQALLANFKR